MVVEPRDGRSLNFDLVQLLFVRRVDFSVCFCGVTGL